MYTHLIKLKMGFLVWKDTNENSSFCNVPCNTSQFCKFASAETSQNGSKIMPYGMDKEFQSQNFSMQ